MTQWTDLLPGSPHGPGSLIVILAVSGTDGSPARSLISRSR